MNSSSGGSRLRARRAQRLRPAPRRVDQHPQRHPPGVAGRELSGVFRSPCAQPVDGDAAVAGVREPSTAPTWEQQHRRARAAAREGRARARGSARRASPPRSPRLRDSGSGEPDDWAMASPPSAPGARDPPTLRRRCAGRLHGTPARARPPCTSAVGALGAQTRHQSGLSYRVNERSTSIPARP